MVLFSHHYTASHVALCIIAVVDVLLLLFMAFRMYAYRYMPIVRARGVNFVIAHTVVSVLWVALATVRGIGMTGGFRRWPLDLLQYGIVQSAWVCIWLLRNVALQGALFGHVPRTLYVAGLLVALLFFPLVGLIWSLLSNTMSTRLADCVVVATSAIDLFVMHAGILQLRRLPAPVRISAEAEWCCVVALTCMLVVSLLMRTQFEDTGRYFLSPLTVIWVTFSWQYVQCKPVMCNTDASFDAVMQKECPSVLPLYKSEDPITAAFMRFCSSTHPATVYMIEQISMQLTPRTSTVASWSVVFDCTDTAQDERNRATYFTRFRPNNSRNPLFIGDEIPFTDEDRQRDAFHHRAFAFSALRRELFASYERECRSRRRVLERIDSPLFTHPSLYGFGFNTLSLSTPVGTRPITGEE
jgi:hypothetical protein